MDACILSECDTRTLPVYAGKLTEPEAEQECDYSHRQRYVLLTVSSEAVQETEQRPNKNATLISIRSEFLPKKDHPCSFMKMRMRMRAQRSMVSCARF